MPRLRFHISMSADGYVAGPNQTLKEPLGVGGEDLHNWFIPLRTFQRVNGKEGGETGQNDDVAAEIFENLGATIMGRHMFGGGTGPWATNPPWKGWWGRNPPYHTDVFVLTHHPRPSLEMEGGTTFHFVTEGIHSALDRAKKAAGNRDVLVAGGANAAQQFLAAGLVDDMELHIVPLLLGAGERLFENTDGRQTELELVRVIATPNVTHYKYRRRA